MVATAERGHVPRTPNFYELNEGRPHQVARTHINAKLQKMAAVERGITKLERVQLLDDEISWALPTHDMYYPPFVDVPRGRSSFRKEGDAPHPDDPRQITTFESLERSTVQRDYNGYPLNPIGRTGLAGRGMLDKWGATQAADPIVTRHSPENGQLQALLIVREDTGELGLPGGKVDAGEEAWQAATRELGEEAGLYGVDFSQARPVYAGYVDDSRNTDNAWMETTALHYHLSEDEARHAQVQAGSDALNVHWVTVGDDLYARLFANHGAYLRLAVEGFEQA